MTPFLLLAGLAFLQTLAIGALLTPVARRVAPMLGMIDKPNLERKIHSNPIPRSGGLAIFAAFWGCLAADLALAAWVVPTLEWLPEPIRVLGGNVALRAKPLFGVAGGALIIFVLGAIDDARGLSARLRLGVQILAAIPLIASGCAIRMFLPEPFGWVITIAWVVLLTNSFNFLDNMNGLTSGISVITACMLALLAWLAREYYLMLVFMMLAGAVLGFWFFNFPKASIFLGDSGSTHLGYLFAALTAISTYYEAGVPSKLPILMPVIVLGVPLFDTISVMWIRWRAGKPLMEGDTNHFSHRLVALGMSRTGAVIFIYGVTLCVGLAAVALRPLDWRYGLVQTAVIVLVFVGVYVLERVSRRAKG